MHHHKTLMLRNLAAKDLALLVQIETDSDNLIYSGWNTPPEIDELIALIQDNGEFNQRGQKRFVIELDKQAVGFADLFDATSDLKCCYVGILVIPEMRRQGIALDALHLLQKKAQQFGINTLMAKCLHENTASINLFQKAGFKIGTSTAEFVVLQCTIDS
jgi:RimJ/RimL family protein N-acetyltransferase